VLFRSSVITIESHGDDETAAVQALVDLINNRFGEAE
jgi:phosphotransferase system HPr-like phosphotransfer protein